MSDTTDLMGARVEETAAAPATDASAPATGAGSRRRRGTGLEGMVLAELQQVASGLGIRGTARMRKSQLIEVIKEAQAGGSQAASGASAKTADETKPKRRATSKARTGDEAAPAAKTADKQAEKADKTVAQQQIDIPGQPAGGPARASEAERGGDDAPAGDRRRRRATAEAGSPETVAAEAKNDTRTEASVDAKGDAGDDGRQGRRDRQRGDRSDRGDRGGRDRDRRGKGDEQQQGQGGGGQQRQDRQDRQQQGGGRQDRQDRQQRDNGPQDDDDFEGGRRGRRGRYRDRRGRRGRDEFAAGEPQVADDDVLIPVAGILDILDNYAFIRTSGYLPGPNDVYVSLAQVRKNGLRKGDHVTGAVRQPKDGERREKFNALVRLDSANGMAAESGRGRPEFNKLTPLYPQDRLRLETDPGVLTTRIIDLVSPIGKGQRGLIVAPPKT
ncbi:MAG: transcription termination factor Rho, partial [Streptomyces sp.]|nr:transcription termination factor Rho [Streptomyces sp.]